MRAQGSVGKSIPNYQKEFISVYRENSREILKILRDQNIGYNVFGEDQSRRLLLQITYDSNQMQNVAVVKNGIKTLENSITITDFILTGIKNLFEKD